MLYDPEAFVEPVRIVQTSTSSATRMKAVRFRSWSAFRRSFRSMGTRRESPGQTFEYTVPDIFGRPWAEIWERYHEGDGTTQGTDGPVRPVIEHPLEDSQ